MSKVNSNGFWRRLGSAFERADIDDGASAWSGTEEDAVRPTMTRYAPIREAVERRVQSFMRQDLVSHLEIGFNEIFLLHYIEIAADSQGAAQLDQFLREFPAESRVQWVKKLLGPALGQRVSVEQFLGLDKEFSAAALAETDPYEEQLQQNLKPLYRVILHGRWESGPAAESAASTSPAAPETQAGPMLRLSVQDAKQAEQRTVEIERFPAVLGSSANADVEITGYYVSARHCTLHWDGERLWLADHSTNGTWVDGERVHRGQRVAVANGALLGFGRDRGDAEYGRYPAVRAQFMRHALAPGASATPVAPSASTPVAPGIAPPAAALPRGAAPLAVLAVVDASGNPKHDVLRLPFTIGRGSAQDYVVPDANQGVSREHLVIESIDHSGAVAVNRAVSRNGTFAGTEELPERFVWRFGEEIVLGERWTNAPVVRISLQPVERRP
jgi:pSer/pThr/pTyr-binding forkhead associated (FHA) protein